MRCHFEFRKTTEKVKAKGGSPLIFTENAIKGF